MLELKEANPSIYTVYLLTLSYQYEITTLPLRIPAILSCPTKYMITGIHFWKIIVIISSRTDIAYHYELLPKLLPL